MRALNRGGNPPAEVGVSVARLPVPFCDRRFADAKHRSRFMRIACLTLLVCNAVCNSGCAGRSSDSRYKAVASDRLRVMSFGHTNVQFLHSLKGLPPAVRDTLGTIAEPGAPFSVGCGGDAPHLRLLAATKEGKIYNIAMEQGGFVYTWFIVRVSVDDSGNVVQAQRIDRQGVADPDH